MTPEEIAGLVERAENYQHLARDSEPAHIIGQLVGALTRLEAERDEAVAEADYANISWCIRMADIREASGVGVKPMLDEVPAAIRARIAGIEAARDAAIQLYGSEDEILELARAHERAEKAEAERDGVIDRTARLVEESGRLARMLSLAEARLAEAVKALKPSAKFHIDPSRTDDEKALTAWTGPNQWFHLTWGDIRSAASTYASLTNPDLENNGSDLKKDGRGNCQSRAEGTESAGLRAAGVSTDNASDVQPVVSNPAPGAAEDEAPTPAEITFALPPGGDVTLEIGGEDLPDPSIEPPPTEGEQA